MKNVILLGLISLMFFTLPLVYAADLKTDEVKAQLIKFFPNFSIEYVSESPIPGLYEVVDKNGQIIYWSPKGYVVFGEIWTTTGVSITGERRQQLAIKKFESLDLSKAVKIGSGKNKVITFTDPDCPFCRKGYEYLSKRDDVTEYLFFLPFHGDSSKKKIAYVICSKDKKKAYSEVMSGKEVSVTEECLKKSEQAINDHLSIAQSLNIGGTPTYYVKGKLVQGANIPLLDNVLNGGK
ncbi:DsbC family protein [Thermodesulfovibrio sp. 1176]|uniref:DsbC family protein n=1 Tax=Thermodesulfovibrio sp. 1176 TaxID=3043424 RepID=UPI002482A78B|nr:DsbC family protein [Thermodesulfovibrio sp. 1176]MDI1473010.1 DsbC family protein [Thermodesulfovibrio sp. 1176]